jgi:LmbE family N-acetylglucosaminyl deacetylase
VPRNAPKLLIFAPHPDDEAIACGGLIAHARHRGWRVHVLALSVGSCRQLHTGHTTASARLSEWEASKQAGQFDGRIAHVGASFMHMDTLPAKEIVDCAEDEIAREQPDVVVIPPLSSYDQDHRAIATACMTALRPRPRHLRHFVDVVLEADEPYWWRVDGQRPTPNFFVPLSEDELQEKLAMVRCHATQDRGDPFGRSTDNLLRYARIYGVEIGETYAEAYRVLRLNAAVLGDLARNIDGT